MSSNKNSKDDKTEIPVISVTNPNARTGSAAAYERGAERQTRNIRLFDL